MVNQTSKYIYFLLLKDITLKMKRQATNWKTLLANRYLIKDLHPGNINNTETSNG